MEPEIFAQLAASNPVLAGQLLASLTNSRTKAFPNATPSASLLYGTAGLFATPGVKDPVISAVLLPQSSIASRIPSRTTRIINELYGYVTEANVGSGTEPAGPCDDPPVAGDFKTAVVALPLGRYSRQSKVIDLSAHGLQLNRGVTRPVGMVGGLQTDLPIVPSVANQGVSSVARTAFANAITSLGIAFLRLLGPQMYTGNPTNNNAGGGYKEFKGLNLMVNTGYTDAVAATAAPALDSDVRTFASANISTNPNGDVLVATLTNMIRNLKKRAEDVGLAPTTHALAMRWSAFMEITEVWPCSYLSYRCQSASASKVLSLDAGDVMALRDGMRNDKYLLVDGERIEVIIDDFIVETRPDSVGAPNDFLSDIYILPMTYAGNRAGVFMEFVDFAAEGGLMQAADAFGVQSQFMATDGGRWVIHRKPANNFCAQILGLTMPRLILEVPHLAGRLSNVRYSTAKHEASAITTENTYVGGGVSSR